MGAPRNARFYGFRLIRTLVQLLVRGDVHTQFVTQNVKMTLSIQPIHQPLKTSGGTKYFFYCKTTYTGTIGNRATAKDLPAIPWELYSTKIENITIKITQSFTSFHIWHSKLLHWSVRRNLRILFQEVLIGMHNF